MGAEQLIIGGQRREPASGKYFDVLAPATESIIASVPRGNAEDENRENQETANRRHRLKRARGRLDHVEADDIAVVAHRAHALAFLLLEQLVIQ